MEDLEKIEKYFEFYDMDFVIKRENRWYYLVSEKYNCRSNTLKGLLSSTIRDLKLC